MELNDNASYRECGSRLEFEMQFNRKHYRVAISLMLLLLVVCPAPAMLPQNKEIVASANGEGLLKMGQEEFKVTAVVVKLKEDRTAEINLISEITVFVSGTWSSAGDPKNGIKLEITGGASKGALEGGGTLFLRDEGKSIASLKLQVFNKASKRTIDVSFVGK
jgi:hypothetical protein